MSNLYEKWVLEPITTIDILNPNLYLINKKWSVNLATNKVDRKYPDPE